MDELRRMEALEQDALIPIPQALLAQDADLYSVQASSDCDWCEVLCQELCEHNAECSCQAVCQTGCQVSCQSCQGECQTACQKSCQSCQSGCQTSCEYSSQCDSCQNICQDICEHNAECSCQAVCQTACQSGCQSSQCGSCESACQEACQVTTQVPKKRSGISVSNITYNSATIRITRNDASTIHLVVREGSESGNTILDTGNVSIAQATASHTLTGLAPSTTYAYNLWDDIGGWIGTLYFTTTAVPFTRFNWTYAGLDSGGSLVYGSEKRSGLGVYVAASEWNDLADLVEDVTGSSVTRVSSGTTISAGIVNTMAAALGVSRVSSGDPISAGFFNRLRTAYNDLEP